MTNIGAKILNIKTMFNILQLQWEKLQNTPSASQLLDAKVITILRKDTSNDEKCNYVE